MQKQHSNYHLVFLAFYQLLASIFMQWRPVEIADAKSDNFPDVRWIEHFKFSTKVENNLVSVIEENAKIKNKTQHKKNPTTVNAELTCQSCSCLWIMEREYNQLISINIICHEYLKQ